MSKKFQDIDRYNFIDLKVNQRYSRQRTIYSIFNNTAINLHSDGPSEVTKALTKVVHNVSGYNTIN